MNPTTLTPGDRFGRVEVRNVREGLVEYTIDGVLTLQPLREPVAAFLARVK